MTDKELIKQEIERLSDEYPMSRGMLKHLTIFIDSLPEKSVSVEETDCTTCVNDKGCVTCENGELYESANENRINECLKRDKEAYKALFRISKTNHIGDVCRRKKPSA